MLHPMFTYEERTRLDRLPDQHDHAMSRTRRPRRRMRIRHLPRWVLALIRPRSRDVVIDLRDGGPLSAPPAPVPTSVAEVMIDAPAVDVERTTAAAGAPTVDM